MFYYGQEPPTYEETICLTCEMTSQSPVCFSTVNEWFVGMLSETETRNWHVSMPLAPDG